MLNFPAYAKITTLKMKEVILKIFQQDSDRDDQYACRNNNVMV